MSINLVRTVRAKKLASSTLKNVLVYLAERASDDGRNIWPAIDTIAKETGFSTSTVDVAISNLKSSGLIAKVGAKKLPNGKRTSLYEIDLSKLHALPEARIRERTDWQKNSVLKSGQAKTCNASNVGSTETCDTRLSGGVPPDSRVQYTKDKNILSNTKSSGTSSPSGTPTPCDPILTEGITAYNDTAKKSGWYLFPAQDAEAKALLRQRLEALGGIEGWYAALERAAESDFLCGRSSGTKFKLQAKYLFKKFKKLQDGGFDNADSRMRSVPASAAADKHHILMGRILREIAFDHRVEYWKLRSPKFAPQYPKAIQAARDVIKKAGIPENIISKFFGEVMA
ncbi:helix-turn-helix domain-containing protein [Sulfitobacter pontiacus]|uniref:helix-turn-helix domain-containing protein n=1 Tax=Sulfitobacter pontiacus TaxID=60137 RepID=UPI0021A77872|nr:helix-turn-helix domain-containing protein [Sulfitobacter pontiacus]UWR20827.1 helix-turn-helix domain-containing protein [Sulfitobacter pontiacus]